MSVLIKETDLPQELTVEECVEAAYTSELAEAASKLQRALPTLIECDKELGPYIYVNIRNRLRNANIRCLYLDGRPREQDQQQQGAMPQGMIGTMISQLREAVRGSVERRVVVLPHLDLLTTSQGGLTAEAREVIPLMYENPELIWLGLKDPSFPLPKVIENLFPHHMSLLGIGRTRLRHLIARRESRKFGRDFNPWGLYKYVSGMNAVRLRKLLSTLEGEDYPANPQKAYLQLRQATLGGTMEVPTISLDNDIGGYVKVKEQLRNEVLNLLARKDTLTSEEQIKGIEELLPKGMIFWGPPGTGKTLFAKAMASEIGAAVTVVSGPELKSKWVGESLPWEEEIPVVFNGEFRRMPIGELVDNHSPNDEVLTWTATDDGSACLAPVTGFIRHKGPDYIDVLVTETGREVRVTGGHSLFVNRDGQLSEVFAEEVEPGKTRVAVPLTLKAPESVRELNLWDLLGPREDVRVAGYEDLVAEATDRIGSDLASQAVGVAVKRLTHKCRPMVTMADLNNLATEAGIEIDPAQLTLFCRRSKAMPGVLPLTEDLAEFLGMWTAEGCYVRKGVRLTVHENEVDHFEALATRLFGHVTRYRKNAESKGVDLIISNAMLRHVMEDGLKMASGSANKRVPSVIFLAPKPVVAAFLRGYFQGDGTFSGKYIEATTISKGLANDVTMLLQYFGIAARLRQKPEWSGSTSWRVRFLWTGFLRKFRDEIGFVSEERNEKLSSYLDNMTFQRKLQTPESHITNDVLWDLVVEKRREPYSREHVYDISVPQTERFLAGLGNVLVHNSEDNLRQIFHKARQSAPSIIVFDEIDSFATARGTYTGSGVEHSMVNQLLTEMDGFHREEMVFIVGTTNFVESLDPALLRPGRFEFHLHIPYPDKDARLEIFKIYDKKMNLKMTEEAFEYAVKRTGDGYQTAQGTSFSGDHINALCRSIARIRLREGRKDETKPEDIDRSLTEYDDKLNLTPREEQLLATHEAGHFIVAIHCPDHPSPERITIQSEMSWAPAYVRFKQDETRRLGWTRNQMLDDLCVLLGGIEAERLLLSDISTGAGGSDLSRATVLAHLIIETYGMGTGETGLRQFRSPRDGERYKDLSEEQKTLVDREVSNLIREAQERCKKLLMEHKPELMVLRDEVIKHKTIETKDIGKLMTLPPGKDEPKEEKPKDEKPKKKAKGE